MRASRRLVLLASLALLGACNALTGASDLTVGACEGDGCGAVEGGAGGEGGADAPTTTTGDGATLDAPSGDTSTEGPGGMLDPTFGTGGIVATAAIVDPHAVAVRADGRILVVGSFSSDLAAAAFTPAGAVDMTFGTAGRVTKGLGSSSVGNAVAFDSQGRAVVGGSSVVVATVTTHYAYAVRIGASQVDTVFANNGGYRGQASGEDGRGIVATPGDGMVLSVSGGNDFRFTRLGPDGVPDDAFGTMGTAIVANVGGDPIGLVAQADGFVGGGTANAALGGQALAAIKVSLTGQPVNTFGTLAKATSKVAPNNTEQGRAIAAQGDAKVLLTGDYDPQINLIRRVTAVTRLTSNGQVDTTYGTGGKVAIDLTEPLVGRDAETIPTNLIVDAQGRALVVGNVHDKILAGGGGDRYRTWVARLRADGTFDPLFGTQGKLVYGTAPTRLEVRGAALQPDGKLVVVGVDTNGNTLFLARIITSTTP